MRILHAHKYFYLRAGAERYMLGLMERQEREGHVVAPFAMHHKKNMATPWSDFFVSEVRTERAAAGYGAIRQVLRAFWSREAEKKMTSMIRVFKPHVVHAHNIYTHLSPSILKSCADAGVPAVMTIHDYGLISANYTLWNGNKPMKIGETGLLKTASTRFVKGSFLATLVLDFIVKWHRFRQNYDRHIQKYLVSTQFVKDVLVEHGFDEQKVAVEGLMIHNQPEVVTGDDGYVLFVGRLETYKGLQTLLEAMRAFPNTILKIAGTGSNEVLFRDLAQDMTNVQFLGFVNGAQLWDLVSRARVSVVPSLWYEPYGFVAVESMSAGTPVIVSDRGGLPELVEDDVSGRIFRAGDANHLKEVLRPFMENENYAQSLGEVAVQRAKQIASPAPHVEKITRHYESLIRE